MAATLKGHGGPVRSVRLAPDGKTLATGSQDKTVSIWSMGTWARERALPLSGAVNSLAFSPDSTLLAIGSSDDKIGLWSTATWECTRSLSQPHRIRMGVNQAPTRLQ